jgi:hypothetical protein
VTVFLGREDLCVNRCHASSDSLQLKNPLCTILSLAPIAEFLLYRSRRITIASEYADRPQWMEKTVGMGGVGLKMALQSLQIDLVGLAVARVPDGSTES